MKHWVRRRTWIGLPIGRAESAVKFSSLEERAEAEKKFAEERRKRKEEEEAKKKANEKSLFQLYFEIQREGAKLQHTVHQMVCLVEKIANLLSWRLQWATSLVYWCLVLVVVLMYFLDPKYIFWAEVTALFVGKYLDRVTKMRQVQKLIRTVKLKLSEYDPRTTLLKPVRGRKNKCMLDYTWPEKISMKSLFVYMDAATMSAFLADKMDMEVEAKDIQACDSLWHLMLLILSHEGMQWAAKKAAAEAAAAEEKPGVPEAFGFHNFILHLPSDWEIFCPACVFRDRKIADG
mmetsp:Transcript_40027/g.100154  ORF Transcript_40027/g.100154 Transcript_40027/m.100154 type:complete len:290 (+) Transcript_40027:1065-1934(+)